MRFMSLRCVRLIAASGLCLGLSSLALAMPAAFERVSDDAAIVVVLPAPDTFQKNLSDLTTAVESPIPLPTIKDALAMSGFGAGIDTTRGVAMVLVGPKEPFKNADEAKAFFDKSEDHAMILLPVTNYAEFMTNFNAKPAGNGAVDAITMNSGEPGFAKDLGAGAGGAYALLGSNKDMVQAFTGKAGANPIKGKIGKAGEKLADSSDLVTFFNAEVIRPLIPEVLAEMKKQAKAQTQNAGMDDKQFDARFGLIQWLIESGAKDTRSVVGGAKFSSLGIALDMVSTFSEGSYFAKVFATGGKPGALLARLPAQPYLLAGAIDQSSPGFKQFSADYAAKASEIEADKDKAKLALGALTSPDGIAGAVGFPIGGIFAGALTSTISFTKAKDGPAAVKIIKDAIVASNGTSQQGVTASTTYKDAGAKVGDTDVDVWSASVAGDGDKKAGATQGMQMLFGSPDGPVGFVAKTEGGAFLTYSKNADLMEKALKVGGETMASDKTLAQVADKLPGDRIAEAYVGVKGLLDLALPFVAMIGVPIPQDKLPAQLPPVGLAIASDAGSARFTIFVPAPVIKTGVIVGTNVMQQLGQQGQPGGDPNGGGGQKSTGQPKF